MKNGSYLRIPTIFNIAEMEQNIGKAKNQTNNTISNISKIKGISSCYHCQENNILYDEDRDEIYCFDCGTVLRQGLTDYQPYPKIEIDNVYDKTHYEAIIELLKK